MFSNGFSRKFTHQTLININNNICIRIPDIRKKKITRQLQIAKRKFQNVLNKVTATSPEVLLYTSLVKVTRLYDCFELNSKQKKKIENTRKSYCKNVRFFPQFVHY